MWQFQHAIKSELKILGCHLFSPKKKSVEKYKCEVITFSQRNYKIQLNVPKTIFLKTIFFYINRLKHFQYENCENDS